jgi:hypothetical protein
MHTKHESDFKNQISNIGDRKNRVLSRSTLWHEFGWQINEEMIWFFWISAN